MRLIIEVETKDDNPDNGAFALTLARELIDPNNEQCSQNGWQEQMVTVVAARWETT